MIRARAVVVMGVAGAGKTVVGRALARALGWTFLDADDLHPARNVERMHQGIGLTDRDRAPWLAAVHRALVAGITGGAGVVVACSALRERYRRTLRGGRRDVRFVWLDVSPALARRRLARRRGHFAGPALVGSQFETLEPPRRALRIDGALPVGEIVHRLAAALGAGPPD